MQSIQRSRGNLEPVVRSFSDLVGILRGFDHQAFAVALDRLFEEYADVLDVARGQTRGEGELALAFGERFPQ